MRSENRLLPILIIESLFLFCASGAYFFWFSKISVVLSLSAVVFPLLISGIFLKKFDESRLLITLLFSFAFIMHSIVTGGSFVFGITLAIIPFFLLVPASLRVPIIDFYILRVFPILLLLSVAFYLLEGFGITHLPVFAVQPINEAKDYYYISHIFFLQDSKSLLVFDRFNSYYEECGVIGSMISLFLFSHGERMSLWVKIVYILSGFLTFSLFFYVMFTFYLFISFKGKKSTFIVLLLIVLLIGYFMIQFYESEFLEMYITNRFDYENKEWISDRETDYFMHFFWNDFIKSGDLFFGTTRVKSEGWSIFRCIVENGIIVVATTVLLYVSCIMRNKSNKKRWIYLIVFLAMFYQRPEFWSILYFILFSTISDIDVINELPSNKISPFFSSKRESLAQSQ